MEVENPVLVEESSLPSDHAIHFHVSESEGTFFYGQGVVHFHVMCSSECNGGFGRRPGVEVRRKGTPSPSITGRMLHLYTRTLLLGCLWLSPLAVKGCPVTLFGGPGMYASGTNGEYFQKWVPQQESGNAHLARCEETLETSLTGGCITSGWTSSFNEPDERRGSYRFQSLYAGTALKRKPVHLLQRRHHNHSMVGSRPVALPKG